MALRRPKKAPRRPKKAPRRPKRASSDPQDSPNRAPDAAQEGPKRAPRRPETPKMAPRRPKRPPTRPQRAPKWPRKGPWKRRRHLQEASKRVRKESRRRASRSSPTGQEPSKDHYSEMPQSLPRDSNTCQGAPRRAPPATARFRYFWNHSSPKESSSPHTRPQTTPRCPRASQETPIVARGLQDERLRPRHAFAGSATPQVPKKAPKEAPDSVPGPRPLRDAREPPKRLR